MRPVPRMSSVSPVNTRSAHEEGIEIVGVPRRVKHIEAQSLDLDAVAFRHAHGDNVGVRLLAHHCDAMSAVAQRTQSGDMVGVQMRVGGLDQLEIELAHELQIAVDLLQHRIDDQRLAAMPAGDEIGVGAGNAVEELAEDHRRLHSANLRRAPREVVRRRARVRRF